MSLTKQDLRTIWTSLARLLPPGSLPKDPEELVEIERVRGVVAEVMKREQEKPERGARVLVWRVPASHALTMNAYSYKRGWVKKRMRTELDAWLRELIAEIPGVIPLGDHTRRWVRVTRFSPQRVDELSVDVLGGKMAIDALVRVGVLVDDDDRHLIREPLWMKTKKGNTHVLVEVFEVANEAVPVGPPEDGPAPLAPERPKKPKVTDHVRAPMADVFGEATNDKRRIARGCQPRRRGSR